MDDSEIQSIGVKKETLGEARDEIHYNCRPHDWQMFEMLVSFCKDHPNEFIDWKKEKLEKIKKKWKKKLKK